MLCHYAECRLLIVSCYAECNYSECHYAECHFAACFYAECRGAYNLAQLNLMGSYLEGVGVGLPHLTIKTQNIDEMFLPLKRTSLLD